MTPTLAKPRFAKNTRAKQVGHGHERGHRLLAHCRAMIRPTTLRRTGRFGVWLFVTALGCVLAASCSSTRTTTGAYNGNSTVATAATRSDLASVEHALSIKGPIIEIGHPYYCAVISFARSRLTQEQVANAINSYASLARRTNGGRPASCSQISTSTDLRAVYVMSSDVRFSPSQLMSALAPMTSPRWGACIAVLRHARKPRCQAVAAYPSPTTSSGSQPPRS